MRPVFLRHVAGLFIFNAHMLKNAAIAFIFIYTLAAQGQVGKPPVARYSFNDGTPRDEIGNNDGMPHDLVLTKDRFGNANSAYFFRGNYDSYLSLGTSNTLKPIRGSISVWAFLAHVSHKGRGLLCNPIIFTRSMPGEDFNDAYVISYGMDVNKLNAAVAYSEYKQIYLVPVEETSIREWHHLVLTYNDNVACFYIDGVLEAKSAKNFESRFLQGDSVIVGGQLEHKNSRYFQGMIDDIEIYDYVLTPNEVQSLYNAPNPNKTAIILKWVGIGILILLVLLFIAWLIKRRVSRVINAEKEKNRINARLLELETRALRAQMNPHFIFNSLNTLQRFVLEDHKEKSYTYLIEFSRLLRQLLETSESDTISLKEEIDILTSYLEIEKLRFDNSFEYEITSNIVNMEFVYIPIMLVQPFAENAIWHGLLNKKGKRLLRIDFRDMGEKQIACEVDDNGVGRGFKEKDHTEIKKKSMALDFIRQRLDIIKQSTGLDCSFEIIDKKDVNGNPVGTTVRLILPKM